MQGLHALPSYEGEVFIGLEQVDRDKYRVGKEFTWDRFVSGSTMWRVRSYNCSKDFLTLLFDATCI